jgi:hypothetical protein
MCSKSRAAAISQTGDNFSGKVWPVPAWKSVKMLRQHPYRMCDRPCPGRYRHGD